MTGAGLQEALETWGASSFPQWLAAWLASQSQGGQAGRAQRQHTGQTQRRCGARRGLSAQTGLLPGQAAAAVATRLRGAGTAAFSL